MPFEADDVAGVVDEILEFKPDSEFWIEDLRCLVRLTPDDVSWFVALLESIY